jgi:hypothetical protein
MSIENSGMLDDPSESAPQGHDESAPDLSLVPVAGTEAIEPVSEQRATVLPISYIRLRAEERRHRRVSVTERWKAK